MIERNIKITSDLCDTNSYYLCNTSLNIAKQLLPSIRARYESIQSLPLRSRSKRGLFNGFGTIFKTLFGTLDQNDADYYNNVINKANSDEKQFTTLLKDQAQVVKTTIQNFNSSISNIEENNRIFEINMNKIYNLTLDNSKTQFNQELKQVVDEHISFLTLIISEINNELISIIDATFLTRNNQIHPMVITPEQFLIELSKSLAHLPASASYALPIDREHAQELLTLTHISCHPSEDRIIFTLEIPLINQQRFNLFKLIPLPSQIEGNEHIFILPSANYLALSEHRTQYTTLSDLNACTTLSTKTLVCSTIPPIYSTYSKPTCETELVLHPTPIPKSCDIRTIQNIAETWEPLAKLNSWLFVLPKETSVTISCRESQPNDYSMNKIGIITLNQDCRLYSTTTILRSKHANSYQQNYYSYLPAFNISEDECYKIKLLK